jgi:hypothetical protein
MRAPKNVIAVAAVAALGFLTAGATAPAAPAPDPYHANDAGGFRDILPPGTDGVANAADLGTFTALKTRPKHNDDQLETYASLVYAAPGLKPEQPPKQLCSDATRFKAIGAIKQPAIHWINRPTYQQIVEVQGHRPR